MRSLEGATALVTGGASGIGAATVRRLAAGGARLVVADVDEQGAKATAKEVDGLGVALDVTDLATVPEVIGRAEQEVGPVTVLVNNAGGAGFAFFVDTDPHGWSAVVGLNLLGVLACTHAVLPGMQSRRGGAIVNVASEAGRVGSVAGAAYAAAKAGVIGFTKAIARESARYGVRCNAVAPGPVDTPLLDVQSDLGARIKQGMIDATLMGRAGTPDEVADAIAFLASERASYITGQTLSVSGGLSLL